MFLIDIEGADIQVTEEFIWLQKPVDIIDEDYINKWLIVSVQIELETFYQKNTIEYIFKQLPNLSTSEGLKLVSKQ